MMWIPENLATTLSPILAQLRRAKVFKWAGSKGNDGMMLLLILLTLFLGLLALLVTRRLKVLVKHASPKTVLFDELVKTHSLSKIERAALKRIARNEKLSTPSELFVRQAYLEAYAKSNNPVHRALYKKLFAK